eukprot:7041027-Pyramimonas_sp.AAC.1
MVTTVLYLYLYVFPLVFRIERDAARGELSPQGLASARSPFRGRVRKRRRSRASPFGTRQPDVGVRVFNSSFRSAGE